MVNHKIFIPLQEKKIAKALIIVSYLNYHISVGKYLHVITE